MGDMGELWREVKKDSKHRRSANRANSAKILEDCGITFESKNHGAHLVVAGAYDFWPGTGKYISRKTGQHGRGVFKLINEINAGAKQ